MGRAEVMERLFDVIEARRTARPEGSYVVTLLDGGHAPIAAKVVEEAAEFVEAAAQDDAEHTAEEAADLFFHCFVMLAHKGLRPDSVYRVLERRFGVGGLVEKAGREDAE